MIPGDAHGPQAAHARGGQDRDHHQHQGGRHDRTRDELEEQPARGGTARDRPAPTAPRSRRPTRRLPASRHRAPSLRYFLCALIGSPETEDAGVRRCRSTNQRQLPDIWKLGTQVTSTYGRAAAKDAQGVGTRSRKPSTSASRPSASAWATSNPTTTASAPSGPSSQVNRAWSWWASTAPARRNVIPPNWACAPAMTASIWSGPVTSASGSMYRPSCDQTSSIRARRADGSVSFQVAMYCSASFVKSGMSGVPLWRWPASAADRMRRASPPPVRVVDYLAGKRALPRG